MWKLSDGVCKADFRHWLESIDTQLEALHGLEYADLVLQKVKRLPTEVAAELLEKCIKEINEEHNQKIGPGAPPGIGEEDPWAKRLGSAVEAVKGRGEFLLIPASGTFPKRRAGSTRT